MAALAVGLPVAVSGGPQDTVPSPTGYPAGPAGPRAHVHPGPRAQVHPGSGAHVHPSTRFDPTTTTTAAPGPAEPGGGLTLFPQDRIVAFYGEAAIPALGVLGDAPPAQLWPKLAAQAAAYARPGTRVLPAYELIAYVAQGSAGPGATYTARIPNATIATYLSVVREHHGLLILDIQPGRSSFLADAQALAPWLKQPDVALALDPEWELQPGQVPLRQIGHTTAAQINAVSAWLAQLVSTHHLPQKLLLVHQFTPYMVQDKAAVAQRSGIALAFNMDGFGTQAEKLAKYKMLAADPLGYLGLKLFYDRDVGLFTPAQVLAVKPTPNIVEYE